ncbi:hypothetical protein [Paenibacillus sp. Soil787]|uniref:hypothetical protein n=1 Tax=Paenibacillus sp. Soil787 TaxID=1736411 RepID=UPI000702A2B9|nr:hypothetical protein [Paenibacillus sp. Soil787]KRF21772.1 hypothetical protein ASG93_30760 [Paenibacillus sp. Soil787]
MNFEWVNIDRQYFEGKLIIFKSFGDGVNFLTGGIKKEQTSGVHFDLVEVEIVCADTGSPVIGSNYETMYFSKMDLNFVFVAEDNKVC